MTDRDIPNELRLRCLDWDGSEQMGVKEPRQIPSCHDLREAAEVIEKQDSKIYRLAKALDAIRKTGWMHPDGGYRCADYAASVLIEEGLTNE